MKARFQWPKKAAETRSLEVVQLTLKHSVGARWDGSGQCFESVNGGAEQRRPDMDFGTPSGDLIIDPWIQDIVTSSSGRVDKE